MLIFYMSEANFTCHWQSIISIPETKTWSKLVKLVLRMGRGSSAERKKISLLPVSRPTHGQKYRPKNFSGTLKPKILFGRFYLFFSFTRMERLKLWKLLSAYLSKTCKNSGKAQLFCNFHPCDPPPSSNKWPLLNLKLLVLVLKCFR